MQKFNYVAADKNGKKIKGEFSAESEEGLEQYLESQGAWLIEAKVHSAVKKNSALGGKVSRAELADFFNGMGALTLSGVTLLDALITIKEETENDYFADVLDSVIVSIESGTTMHMAFSQYPRVFSAQISNMVNAGEHSGRIAETFVEISEHLEWVEKIVSDIKQASTYPMILLCAVFGLLTVMIVVVVPRFVAVFDDAGIELPASTKYMMWLGDIWWWMAGAVFIMIIVMKYFSNYIPYMSQISEYIKFYIPVFGVINRMLTLSMFSHNLSLLLKSGVPLQDSLAICRDIVQSQKMREMIIKAESAVNEGKKMSDSLRGSPLISPLMLRMLRVGEETGSLEKSLQHVSTRLDTEIPRKIKKAFSVLEPMITFAMMIIIGVVASAILSPMFKMMSGLSN